MSHPIQFLDYTCGHSAPVRGTGARVPRDCPECLKNPRRAQNYTGLGMLRLAQLMGYPPRQIPDTYAECRVES